jgi:hypothetical protein
VYVLRQNCRAAGWRWDTKIINHVCLGNVFDNFENNCSSISSNICQFVLSRIKMNKLKYRAVIKLLTKQGKAPKIIREEMLAVYGDDCPSKSTICEWSKLFKHGRKSLDDDLRPGRPVDAITSDVIEKTKCLVLEDARLKKRQLAPLLGVSETTVFRILHEYHGMTKVSARWVSRMLSPFQIRVQMETCEQFLTLCGDEPDLIFNRLVTGDQTWVHHFDPEWKQKV